MSMTIKCGEKSYLLILKLNAIFVMYTDAKTYVILFGKFSHSSISTGIFLHNIQFSNLLSYQFFTTMMSSEISWLNVQDLGNYYAFTHNVPRKFLPTISLLTCRFNTFDVHVLLESHGCNY